jgi:hypothetical protein
MTSVLLAYRLQVHKLYIALSGYGNIGYIKAGSEVYIVK